MYQNFINSVSEAANDLSTNGLYASNAPKYLDLFRRYGSEINTLKGLTKKMEEIQNKAATLTSKDDTIRFRQEPGSLTIDDYLHNPLLDPTQEFVSGKVVKDKASALAKQLVNRISMIAPGQPIDDYTNTLIKQYGLTPELIHHYMEIKDNPGAMQEDKDSAMMSIMNDIVRGVVNNTRVASWNNPELLDYTTDQAIEGLWRGIGKLDISTYDNKENLAILESVKKGSSPTKKDDTLPSLDKNNPSRPFIMEPLEGGEDLYETLQSFKAGQQSVKGSIFGKDGKGNPLKAYEAVQNLYKDTKLDENAIKTGIMTQNQIDYAIDVLNPLIMAYDSAYKTNFADVLTESMMEHEKELADSGLYNTTTISEEGKRKYAIEAFKAVRNMYLKNYGVTQEPTKAQYNALKKIGWEHNPNNPILSIKQLEDLLDKSMQSKNAYAANLTDYAGVNKITDKVFNEWEENGTFQNKVYKLDKYGNKKEGEGVKKSSKMDYDEKENPVTEVLYSKLYPNNIIIQLKDGKRYLVDSSLFLGDNNRKLQQLFNEYKSLAKEDKTYPTENEAAQYVAADLTSLLGYGQEKVQGKTGKEEDN